MDETGESSEGADSFDALLKEAARTSRVIPSAALSPGRTVVDGRLEVVRRLGEGGMGVVYEAYDRERRQRVALKTLSRLDASSIYRMKNEFRALSDVSHENLVRLHELFVEDDHWFFTMDLVEGVPFDTWVRKSDEARLRQALSQLAAGVRAIHDAGKLHRDLKPSNVLVTAEGRLVVLDFGLAADPEVGGVGQTVADESVSGTPAYMAPEQAAGREATSASDWYAVGVMLFEALTGELPFDGRAGEIIAAKQVQDAPRARDLTPGVPEDLDALCAGLLAREPAGRQAATARLLSETPAERAVSRPPSLGPSAEALLGREGELARLRDAYASSAAGQATFVAVSGESGMGKSALVDAFVAELRAEGRAVVLAGRCYERENVPFKGLDAVVDELSRYLRRLPDREAAALLPREVFALARLFPVLGRVPVVAEAPSKEVTDPQDLRQRGLVALSELFGAIRDRHPLVVYVDDLQWVDRDTTVVMRYLLERPSPSPGLAIGSHRVEGAAQNALLQQVLDAARHNRAIRMCEVEVGALPAEAARALSARLLGAGAGALADAVGREAGGSPFFVGELSRYVARRGGGTALSGLTLDEALADHLQSLPPEAGRLLEVLALVGRPLPAAVVLQAAGVSDHGMLESLRHEQLVRSSGGGAGLTECYHDRIRESVRASLPDVRVASLYADVAAALGRWPEADPELVAECHEGAGDLARAAEHAELAGDRAVEALAFERAARLYQRVHELLQSEGREPSLALRLKLADARSGEGKVVEAGRALVAAAEVAEPAQALQLKRRAAEQLLRSGYHDEGKVLLAEVFEVAGLRLPATPTASLLSYAIDAGRLRLRSLGGPTVPDEVLPEHDRTRLDALQAAFRGLVGNDAFLMRALTARYLLEALRARAQNHLVQALGCEAYFVSMDGPRTAPRTDALLSWARQLADAGGGAYESFQVDWIRANAWAHEGKMGQAADLLRRLAGIAQEQHSGDWFLRSVNIYQAGVDFWVGDFEVLAGWVRSEIEHARRRGDQFMAGDLSGVYSMPAWLAEDDIAGARRHVNETERFLVRQPSYQWSNFFALTADQALAIYVGDTASALERTESEWPALERAELLRLKLNGAIAHLLRGGCALGVLAQRPEVRRIVERSERALRRQRVPYGYALADVLRAALAVHDRRVERAVRSLQSALARFEAMEASMYAAATRRRLGELLGGDEGAAVLAEGDAAMGGEGVLNLDAMTEMLIPGCRQP